MKILTSFPRSYVVPKNILWNTKEDILKNIYDQRLSIQLNFSGVQNNIGPQLTFIEWTNTD